MNINKNRLKINTFFLFLFFISITFSATSGEFIDADLKAADAIRSSDPVQFKAMLNKVKNSEIQLSSEQQHYLNYLLAYHHSFSGQFDKSINVYKKIINSDASLELIFRANSSIVNIYAISQNWAEGLIHLSKNFEILEQINNKEIQQNGLVIAALFYNRLGQYELGMQSAKKVQLETKNDRTLCFANQLLLEAKFKLKSLDENSKEIEYGLSSCEQINETIMFNFIRSYLAALYIDNGDIAKAISLLQRSISEVEKISYAPLLAKLYSLLGKSYFLDNKLTESASYANKVLLKTKGSGNILHLISAYSLLYKIEYQNKNYLNALQHYIKYAEADKAHLEDEKAKHLAFQLAEHKEFEQKTKIEFLNKKNSLLTAEQALIKANAANTRLIIIVLVLAISVLIFWGIRLLKAHKRIKELAEYDALTGVFNRGHFTQVADSAIEYCKNSEQALSIIMFDLDHFKKINDNYGHACGDWALKKTVTACKKISRQNDILARLGGEEFCVLLTSCDSQSAQLRAEAFRKAIADINTADSGFNFTITASFGITDANTSGFNLESLLADADSAAYAAKHAGRNQIIVFKPEVPGEDVVVLDDSRNPF